MSWGLIRNVRRGRLQRALSGAATTFLPAVSALYCFDGLIGVYTHVQGIRKRPGGFDEPLYNIVMGPPLLAPGSLALVGGMGLLAAVVQREH
jgi:hypothetical protein